MIVCPRGRTTSRCYLEWDTHSPYCNGCFAPSLHILHQIVQQFLRTTIMVSFRDVTGMKLCPNHLALRIDCGTEKTLIRKENMAPLMSLAGMRLLLPAG
ncbi:hypothetical protein TNCV_4151761 [Trichonephila clavipes]|nr:hypothetical protein TNCV_4151761 [Trichonephila clavipes]